jgi:signal transduction histidine kinase/CheY-like chemotaxis protein
MHGSTRAGIIERRVMWRLLAKDGIAAAMAVGALFLVVPLYAPFGRDGDSSWVVYVVQAGALLSAIAVCLWRLWQRPAVDRRFWSLITLGLVAWLGVHLIEVAIDGYWNTDLRVSLLGDTGYVLLYMLMILALELRPHASPDGEPLPRLRTLALLGSALFALGLSAYTLGVAFVFDRESYASWVPSQFLYLLFDLYLGARLASLALSVEDPRWRASYSWLLVGVLSWLALDGTGLLENLEVVVNPIPAGVTESLNFIGPLLIATGARVSALPWGPSRRSPRPDEDLFRSVWGGPLFANAILFALVHLFVATTTEAPAVAGPRQWVAFTVMLALLAMALFSQRTLAGENERLEAEREAVNERMRLAQRLEALGRLTGGVAHDFNNVLQVIRMCSESLLAELDPRSPQHQHAHEIALASERASALTARLLSLVRERPVLRGDFELNDVVQRTVGTLQRVIGENIQIETALDPKAGAIRADASQLEHALLNMGVNARDAMPRGGVIRVETAARTLDGRHWAVLSVSDEGTGMDATTRARIFEPFFTTKREGSGTGLGLSLVKSFVDELGGRIEVDSRPGAGTTFRLSLPTTAGAASAIRSSATAPRLRGSATVLLVEDEPAVRAVVCGYLRESGFRVLEACDGAEALEILGRERPDLVVTDLTMPHMGGLELAQRIDQRFEDLPVVFITGYAEGDLAASVEARSALRKPFSRAELARHLGEVLAALPARGRRAQPQRAAPEAAVSPPGTSASV